MKTHWFFKVLLVFALLLCSWAFFYFTLPRLLPTQRVETSEIYGLILSDQIWGGDIKIVGDIYSPTNSTVTLLPGTKIKVAIKGDKSNMDFLPWHRKSGVNTGVSYKGVNIGEPFWDETEKIQIHLNKLIIQGEPSNPVIISSDSISPSQYDFNIIRVKSGFITNAVFSNYRRFEIGNDLTIANSSFKDTGECALCISRSSPKILNNTFENSSRESIWIDRGSPEINNNLFINLEGEGIKIDSRRLSLPVITNNLFEMPQKIALDIISGGQKKEGLIARNIFSGNSVIKIACDAKFKIRDNTILGLVGFYSGCDGGFTFGPNFWGNSDSKIVMSEKILNKYSNFKIDIPDVLISPPKEAGRK